VSEGRRRQADDPVGTAVVQVDDPVVDRIGAAEHHVGHVALYLPGLLWFEYGRARALEHHARVVEVEQSSAHAVGMALVVAVIQDQPALFGPDRCSTGPDALAVPQAGTRADDLDVIGPGAHVVTEA